MGLAVLQGNYAINQMRSLYRPLIHAFGENQVVSLPYAYNRYIFDVYINGVMVLREYKAITFATTTYAYLDVAPIVRNYIQSSLSASYPAFVTYQVKYGTEDTSGVITTNVVTETSYAWYGYPSFSNDSLLTDLGLVSYGGTNPLYLSTNRSRVINSYGNYSVYIPIFKSQSYVGGTVNFGTIASPSTYTFNDSLNVVGVYNAKLTYPILFGDTNNVLFDVDGDAFNNMNLNATIGVNFNCTKNNPVMLHFLNAMGGFESFLFSGVNRVNTNIERQSINKLGLITTYTSSGIDRDVSLDRVASGYLGEVKTNYSNTMTHKIKLVSDYVIETDFLWLRELLASPQVFAQIDNNVLMIPVTIETSDWAEKKRGADKIFNLEIDILLGTQSTQLR
jgi:hypothetical protein